MDELYELLIAEFIISLFRRLINDDIECICDNINNNFNNTTFMN